MKRYKIAAVLMIIHGVVLEVILSLYMMNSQGIGFVVSFFDERIVLCHFMRAMYGLARVIVAGGLLSGRMWGLALCVILSAVTLVLTPFLLPLGLLDGVLAFAALVLMLMAYFGEKKIED